MLAPVEELAIPKAHTGFEKSGHQRLTNDWVSGKITKGDDPKLTSPVIVYYQLELVPPALIPKYVPEAG